MRNGGPMKRTAIIGFVIAALALAGFSCGNKYATVNVNVNSAAQAAKNVASSVNANTIAKTAAIAAAKTLFVNAEASGTDFSDGPCLSNNLANDWVADIAHNPRTEVDDQAENQCSAYRNGTAHHFVELDTNGQYIRAE
jgi:hypothetical protein